MEATYDGSVSGSAGVSVGNDNANASVEISAKTGTVASVEAGLNGNNIYAGVSYSDTTEAHLTVSGEVGAEGFGGSGSADAYVKSGTEAEAHLEAGQNGIAAEAGASMGNAAGVDAEGTVNLREASVTAGAGVSIGEHLEAGGGGEATFKDGKATIGVSGELAAGIGLDVDLAVSVDTKQIQQDARVVINQTPKIINTVVHETPKVVNQTPKIINTVVHETPKVVNQTVHQATNVGNTIANETKKTANKAKKFFHL
jgi:hypothetical protein